VIYDLVDGVTGPDPVFPYQSLGDDAGLRHSFVDTAVLNGVAYGYCVCAYDRGMPDSALASLENAKGKHGDPHFVEIRPGPEPSGYLPGGIHGGDTLAPTEGVSDARVIVDVLDPSLLTGHTYELTFDTLGSLADVILTLEDVTLSETLLSSIPLPDTSTPDALPALDGFRLLIRNTSPGFASLGWTGVTLDTCTFDWFTEDRGRGEAVRIGFHDFELEIDTAAGTVAPVLRPNSVYSDLPFVPVDTTFTLPLKARAMLGPDTSEVDRIVCVEPYYMYPDTFTVSPPGWDLLPGGTAWPRRESARDLYPDQIGLVLYEIDLVSSDTLDSSVVFVRTLNGDSTETPPSQGDRFRIALHRPLTPEVTYRFVAVQDSFAEPALEGIKVVPNPYVMQSAFETGGTDGRIMFTHLPRRCDIHIYTLAGEHIASLVHDSDLGYEFFDLKTKHGLDVSYGLYVYVVETEGGARKVGKFAVIR
jgi:hypothetical protein